MFDPRGFIAVGQKLLSLPTDEASCRAAVGRGYYACFLIARDQLFGPDGMRLTNPQRKQILKASGKKAGRDHEAVIQAVALHPRLGPGQRKVLADQLAQLKDARVQADYIRDSSSPSTLGTFGKYGVTSWLDLAHATMALASQVFAMAARLPAYP